MCCRCLRERRGIDDRIDPIGVLHVMRCQMPAPIAECGKNPILHWVSSGKTSSMLDRSIDPHGGQIGILNRKTNRLIAGGVVGASNTPPRRPSAHLGIPASTARSSSRAARTGRLYLSRFALKLIRGRRARISRRQAQVSCGHRARACRGSCSG